MTTAFIAGATGYTGRNVVPACVGAGWTAIAHVRPDSSSLAKWTSQFEGDGASVDSSPWTAEGIADAFARHRPDVVFSLLGTTRARGKQDGVSTYEAVDYGLTKLLVDASLAMETPPVFVYLSSMGAGGTAGNAYLQVRNRIEGELRASAMPHVIARPGFITGPDRGEDRLGETIGAVVSDGFLSLLGALGAKKAERKYRSITGPQLAQALVTLAKSDARGVFESDAIQEAAATSST